ncbi:LacI family DNA-binding transcriptional regulator [Carboxylicivirga sp. RSCT41]|uniref:LacI family DNA-binding transcriptional regulator n=1 Tax=Carboxylicivirga agarovorans TaxID=3417570 RepID=UPI003D33A7AD
MKPSIKTIAERSGVSKTTVSFVLNGRGEEKNISAETQKRVKDIARQLNYRPNHLARSLSMGRSYTIGFVVPDISNPFFSKIARLVEHYAEERGYSVMVASTDEKPDKEQVILETFTNRQIDGVIIAPATELVQNRYSALPIVNFDRHFHKEDKAYVSINNTETARLLTQSLIDKGCQKIGLIGLSSFLPNIKERINGYKLALDNNKMLVDEELVVDVNTDTIKKGVEQAMENMLTADVDGFLFLNNVLAAEGIWLVNRYYPQVIDKIQFASFDNLDVFDYATPKVTSALQPGDAIARHCVEMLCHHIDNKERSNGVRLSTTIIER